MLSWIKALAASGVDTGQMEEVSVQNQESKDKKQIKNYENTTGKRKQTRNK